MKLHLNSSIQLETATSAAKHLIRRSCSHLCLLVAALSTACLALSPQAKAVSPPPDGGYPGGNTAEGASAFFSLSSGTFNTAIGVASMYLTTTGNYNTGIGAGALNFNNADSNTAAGTAALFFNDAPRNTAVGSFALFSNTSGFENTAVGHAALRNSTTAGSNSSGANTGVGAFTLTNNVTGGANTAIGYAALYNNTGNHNIALGDLAGVDLSTGDGNIDVGSRGVVGESSTIRIGTSGTQTATFIAGINGSTASGGAAVFVNSDGKLGTVTSSARFKEEIKPMEKASEAILALRPVTFRYKKELDPNGIPQFGLVAEDVEKVDPNLVLRDARGQVYTVRYEAVNAMLLNEFLKEHRKNVEQEQTITRLQKQVESVAAGVQRVSAQLQLNKSARPVVSNAR